MLDDNIKSYNYSEIVWLPNGKIGALKPIPLKDRKHSHYNRASWVTAIYKLQGIRNKYNKTKVVNNQLVLASDLVTPVITLKAYNNEVDLYSISVMTDRLFACSYKYAITIIPVNSLEPFSFSLMIRDIFDRVKRWSGANWQISGTSRNKVASINYSGVIEFGDKDGGIHAHILLDSWLPAEQLVRLCNKSGAECDVIDIPSKNVEEQKKICRYFTNRQLCYSDIDNKYNTTFSETLTLFHTEH